MFVTGHYQVSETQCKLQVINRCWRLRISVCDDTGHYQALEPQCKCLLQVITRCWSLSVSVCYRSLPGVGDSV